MYECSVLYNLKYYTSEVDYTKLWTWSFSSWTMNMRLFPIPNRIPTWRRNPPAYPAFAEYRKPISTNQGIDDTGTLLRAFLPYSDVATRQSLRNYTGNALVLDNRVSCQAPKLADLTSLETRGWASADVGTEISRDYFTQIQINGTVAPTDRTVHRLYTPTGGIPFSCVAGVGDNAVSVCQLNAESEMGTIDYGFPTWNSVGGLLPEFSGDEQYWQTNGTLTTPASPEHVLWGFPLLVFRTIESGPLNMTRDPAYSFSNVSHNLTPHVRILHPTVSTPEHVPWSTIAVDKEWHPWRVSASLCYTAWDTTTLHVSMNSDSNRTEPLAQWTLDEHFYTSPSVTDQLLGRGQKSHANIVSDFEDRQILRLQEKDTWITTDETTPKVVMPFVQAYSDLSGNSVFPGEAMSANWTALLVNNYHLTTQHTILQSDMQTVLADDTLTYLFEDFMKSSNNSIAHSLSAMIMVGKLERFSRVSHNKTSSVLVSRDFLAVVTSFTSMR